MMATTRPPMAKFTAGHPADPGLYYVEFTGERLGIRFQSANLGGKDAMEVAVVDGFTDEAWGDWVGEVRLGDCVVSVNGKAVEGMEYEGVLDAIRSATIPRRIGFRRFEKGVKSIFRKGTKGGMLRAIDELSRQVLIAIERREAAIKLHREVHAVREAFYKKTSRVEEELTRVQQQRLHGHDQDDRLAQLTKAIGEAARLKKRLVSEVRELRSKLKRVQDEHDLVFYAHMGLRHAARDLEKEVERSGERRHRAAERRRARKAEAAAASGSLLRAELEAAESRERQRVGGASGTEAGSEGDETGSDSDAILGWSPAQVKAFKTLVALRKRLSDASAVRSAALAQAKQLVAKSKSARADGQSPTAASAEGARVRERDVRILDRALDKSALLSHHAEMHARDVAEALERQDVPEDATDIRALHLLVHLLCQNALLQREHIDRSRTHVEWLQDLAKEDDSEPKRSPRGLQKLK